jgi:hypothetical protein
LQQQVFRQELEDYAPPAASLQDALTPEEWVRQFHAWAEGHDRTTPLLSNEAISRENIYPDRRACWSIPTFSSAHCNPTIRFIALPMARLRRCDRRTAASISYRKI